jgi:hypothetical protein
MVCLWRVPSSFLSDSLCASSLSCSEQLYSSAPFFHDVLLHHRPRLSGAKWPWSETQPKSIFPVLNCFSQVFFKKGTNTDGYFCSCFELSLLMAWMYVHMYVGVCMSIYVLRVLTYVDAFQYVLMCTCDHIYLCVYICTHIYMYAFACVYMWMFMCVYGTVCVCMLYLHVCAWIYARVCVHVCSCVYACVFMCCKHAYWGRNVYGFMLPERERDWCHEQLGEKHKRNRASALLSEGICRQFSWKD